MVAREEEKLEVGEEKEEEEEASDITHASTATQSLCPRNAGRTTNCAIYAGHILAWPRG